MNSEPTLCTYVIKCPAQDASVFTLQTISHLFDDKMLPLIECFNNFSIPSCSKAIEVLLHQLLDIASKGTFREELIVSLQNERK